MLQKTRVEALARKLTQDGLRALILGPSSDLEYLAGLELFDDERFKAVGVTAEGKVFAIVPKLYEEEFIHTLGNDVPRYLWADQNWFYGAFAAAAKDFGLEGAPLAMNSGVRAVDAIEIAERHRAKLVNGWHCLDDLRICKSPEELALMRKAGRLADEVINELTKFIKPGMKERDVRREISRLFEEKGADGEAFSSIVATGPNASMPHYSAEGSTIERGHFVVIDFGCRCGGYCSDTTRTLFVGEPTAEDRKIYELVRTAQAAGEAAVRPGAIPQDVDRAARRVIEDAGYGAFFNNRLGHGIGIAVHEAPNIMEGNTTPLRPGMTFSIEPGIYIPGKLGVRIENILAVTDTGFESMNNFPRELVTI